ncbi:succinylglutamate desuccinylase/aspartoacylase family protein [Tunicatimonas pelagia]|uniref:succinylglutamate desuccinylase/aspartoacylase family protein n=1 Tax=Tunicatimonas pelagia TaxID=931531 RepID=UPI002666D630|nr:succinylglutamate desuccinylase/aspartoacylase family protein [Tunicatimonas pelagia]WKN42944.1 succinylglutamate desuccinylase/aspartoacylase family protein [Tunicatimonas pelagia]
MLSQADFQLPVSRLLIEYSGKPDEPMLVIFAGIHGNEPSGLIALQKVSDRIKTQQITLQGGFYGVAGNLPAIQAKTRYCDEDLNRVFLSERIQQVQNSKEALNIEEQELQQILHLTEEISQQTSGKIYFVDCHTTSSESIPYISLNEGYGDSYLFAKDIAATSIMGIEREIQGCLPEWFNRRGWHGFTFEAGQHVAPSSVESQEAMIWQALFHANCLNQATYQELFDWSHQVLYSHGDNHYAFYSVISSYRIQADESFVMEPGYKNFQKIRQGEMLATSNGEPVLSPANAYLLMPLYQKQGSFGFFIAEEIQEDYLEFKELH